MGFSRHCTAVPCLCLIINHWGALLPHLTPEDCPVHALGTSWTDWANHGVCTKTSPCSGAAELGSVGTPPPQNAPQAPTDEGEAEAGPCASQGGSLHAHGLSPASGLGDCASQEHMFPRKPGIRLSQRAHPTISLSAVKVRNSFGYLPGFRKPKKKKGKEPLEGGGTYAASYK